MEKEIGRSNQLATTRGMGTIVDLNSRTPWADLTALSGT